MRRVNADNAATSPLLPEARAAMEPWLDCGNPSSQHAAGRAAKQALDEARESFAEALGCAFGEITFTGSASEAAVLATVGLHLGMCDKPGSAVVSAGEHPCMLKAVPLLERVGCRMKLVPCRPDSTPDTAAIGREIGADTLFVASMHANNETGAVSPRPEYCPAAWVCDAAQSFPTFEADYSGPDLLIAAPHKFGGPKGVGVLRVRPPWKVAGLVAGGGQERDLRGGTENVAAIAGAAAALRWHLANRRAVRLARVAALQAFLQELGAVSWAVERPADSLPGHAFLWFPGCEADALLIRLDRAGISASSGAACSSGSSSPSHVVMASGFDERRARECVRFSFGHDVREDEASHAGRVVRAQVLAMSRL